MGAATSLLPAHRVQPLLRGGQERDPHGGFRLVAIRQKSRQPGSCDAASQQGGGVSPPTPFPARGGGFSGQEVIPGSSFPVEADGVASRLRPRVTGFPAGAWLRSSAPGPGGVSLRGRGFVAPPQGLGVQPQRTLRRGELAHAWGPPPLPQLRTRSHRPPVPGRPACNPPPLQQRGHPPSA